MALVAPMQIIRPGLSMTEAAEKLAPLFLKHSYALADELKRLHKPHRLKIYPTVGKTSDDGHHFLYLAVPQWEDDLFSSLDEHVNIDCIGKIRTSG